MNIKLPISSVLRVIDNTVNIGQLAKLLSVHEDKFKIHFPNPQAGVGYLQWSLEGNDWNSFTDATDNEKSLIAQQYTNCCQITLDFFKDSNLKDTLFVVPEEKNIYYKNNGTGYDIALTAWGYRFPNTPACTDLSIYIKKDAFQKVVIGFEWDGRLIENTPFKLDGFLRITSNDGLFYVDGVLPVGNEYKVENDFGFCEMLKVVAGKQNYIYDLTRYFTVVVEMTKDGAPLVNHKCECEFDGKKHSLQTGDNGRCELRLPLSCPTGIIPAQPQPKCSVSCDNEVQEKMPTGENDLLAYSFSFDTPQAPEIVPEPPVIQDPEPPVEEKPEPEYVEISLLDYGGYPLVDLDFILHTKDKGDLKLKTDEKGKCKIPKENFTHKKKFVVKFEISPEYQEKHDLHDKKKKNKKKK